jgi:hypothetical protein
MEKPRIPEAQGLALLGVGWLLVVVGIGLAAFFAFAYDTTVQVTSTGQTLYGRHATAYDVVSETENLGRNANRVVGVIGGLGLGGDMRRAADAQEATAKIVAAQDAEWRKKADPNEAEGMPSKL